MTVTGRDGEQSGAPRLPAISAARHGRGQRWRQAHCAAPKARAQHRRDAGLGSGQGCGHESDGARAREVGREARAMASASMRGARASRLARAGVARRAGMKGREPAGWSREWRGWREGLPSIKTAWGVDGNPTGTPLPISSTRLIAAPSTTKRRDDPARHSATRATRRGLSDLSR